MTRALAGRCEAGANIAMGRSHVAWVRDRLAPRLRRGDIVVLDNLKAHKAPAVQALVVARGSSRSHPTALPDTHIGHVNSTA
jgi:hypothetical protein